MSSIVKVFFLDTPYSPPSVAFLEGIAPLNLELSQKSKERIVVVKSNTKAMNGCVQELDRVCVVIFSASEYLQKRLENLNRAGAASTILGVAVAVGGLVLRSRTSVITSIAFFGLGLYRYWKAADLKSKTNEGEDLVAKILKDRTEFYTSPKKSTILDNPCEHVSLREKELLFLETLHKDLKTHTTSSSPDKATDFGPIEADVKELKAVLFKITERPKTTHLEKIKDYFYDALAIAWKDSLTLTLKEMVLASKLSKKTKECFELQINEFIREIKTPHSEQPDGLLEQYQRDLADDITSYLDRVEGESGNGELENRKDIANYSKNNFTKKFVSFLKITGISMETLLSSGLLTCAPQKKFLDAIGHVGLNQASFLEKFKTLK